MPYVPEENEPSGMPIHIFLMVIGTLILLLILFSYGVLASNGLL